MILMDMPRPGDGDLGVPDRRPSGQCQPDINIKIDPSEPVEPDGKPEVGIYSSA